MAETKQQRQMRIWHGLTPEQRDYDRLQGRIPIGASPTFETDAAYQVTEERGTRRSWIHGLGVALDVGCTCHIKPPCSFCVEGRHEVDA